MTEIKDRIRQLMEIKQMTQQNFAKFIGLSPAALNGIFKDRTKPTLNTVEAIKNSMPDLSINWLMFGQGEMFESKKKLTEQQSLDTDSSSDDTGQMPNTMISNGSLDDSTNHQINGAEADEAKPAIGHTPISDNHAGYCSEMKFVERPQRQITEIRVYFDDLTFESFVPKK